MWYGVLCAATASVVDLAASPIVLDDEDDGDSVPEREVPSRGPAVRLGPLALPVFSAIRDIFRKRLSASDVVTPHEFKAV